MKNNTFKLNLLIVLVFYFFQIMIKIKDNNDKDDPEITRASLHTPVRLRHERF